MKTKQKNEEALDLVNFRYVTFWLSLAMMASVLEYHNNWLSVLLRMTGASLALLMVFVSVLKNGAKK